MKNLLITFYTKKLFNNLYKNTAFNYIVITITIVIIQKIFHFLFLYIFVLQMKKFDEWTIKTNYIINTVSLN